MSTPENGKSAGEGKTIGLAAHRLIRNTIAHPSTPYRQIQTFAKMFGIPCNLKRDVLKMILKAKLDHRTEEVELLLKQVRETRTRRKKEKAKALELAKALIKVEESNEGMEKEECKESLRQKNIRELLHNMTHVGKATIECPSVTVQKTSTHTRYRAVIDPATLRGYSKSLCMTPSCTGTAQCRPTTIQDHPSVIKYEESNTMSVGGKQELCSSNTVVAVPAQWNNSQFDKTYDWQGSAVSVRETLLQYQRNLVPQESQIRASTSNQAWTTGYYPNAVVSSGQTLPNFNSLRFNNVSKCPQTYDSNSFHNTDSTSDIDSYTSTPMMNTYQANQQCKRNFHGEIQSGLPKALHFQTGNTFFGMLSNSETPLTAVESYAGLQPAYAHSYRDPVNQIPNQNQSFTGTSVNEGSSDVTEPDPRNIDTGLGLLSNMAVTQAQEDFVGNKMKQFNNGLLMISENNNGPSLIKLEPNGCGTKPFTKGVKKWNNFLNEMTNNLSPDVTSLMTPVQCKYGCQITFSNKKQLLDHEEQCSLITTQCPVDACTFVGQLRTMTAHVIDVHAMKVTSGAHGTFHLDLTHGQCSFEHPQSWMINCPKRQCFPQLVDGRLFFVHVIGNFDAMQVVVYIQYVDDVFGWKSQVACEVVLPVGVPLQWTGLAAPMSSNPLRIIPQRNCLVFNMNISDLSKNNFLLHTKIQNYNC